MVKITVFQKQAKMAGFDCDGHAEYADEDDIVCAATSALVITCINSVEQLTSADFQCDTCQEDGKICFRLNDTENADAQLLIRSMVLGLEEIESNYEEFIDLIFEEV